jgi:LacI family transcriptional regulator
MGYRPDPVLSALAAYRFAKQSHKIQSALAWVNRFKDPRQWRKFSELKAYWTGAEKAAERFGYHMEEIIWEPDSPLKRLEKILETRDVLGILMPPHHFPPDCSGFDWNKFSAVRFGMSVRNPDIHAVTTDQLHAVVMAMEKFVNMVMNASGWWCRAILTVIWVEITSAVFLPRTNCLIPVIWCRRSRRA